MIIACPDCSGPFEIPAEHISELVQIECPHCAFRMILDFAAANDPNLVEDGMQMASGFRSAADYRAWSAPAAAPAVPRHLEPAAAAAPEPVARPRAARMTPPGRPAGGVATLTHPEVAAVQAAAARTGGTVVGPAPVPPPAHTVAEASTDAAVADMADVETEAPSARTPPTTPPASPTTQAARPKPVEADAEADVEEPAPPTIDEREIEQPAAKVVERTPPHTPPAPKATSRSTEGEPVPAVPSETSATDLDVYEKQLHGGRAGTVLLVILLLVAGGLVAASVALEGTPDPRPLLEDLYRQAFKR
jgi:DNA-directed RNA polymerase subunit RPC12/RpoP